MKRSLLVVICLSLLALPQSFAHAETDTELRFCIGSEPKTFNPLLVADDASETVRYLTGGVLLRLNRSTQRLQPELASAWKVSADARSVHFTLRPNLRFSDGTPFSAEDVAYTMQQLMDPALHSPVGDSFRSGDGKVITQIESTSKITISFPKPIVGADRLFDQVAIMSMHSPQHEMAVLGPYFISQDKPGTYLLLKRNPYFWKHDAAGRPLPYVGSVRLEIEQNRDIEVLRFLRGEVDFINSLDAKYYDTLVSHAPATAYDAGPSLDSEEIWFNQVQNAPLPAYKKAWFTSTNFRRAISASINRQDLARVVFRGHARPAVGWISPANKFWFNAKLQPQPFDQRSALRLLQQDGFRLQNGVLHDRGGNAVEFSVITNSGNTYRERMATMIQQDLSAIGVRLHVVTLDFPSLIERITRTFNYEACLLGLVNDDLDPSMQMNVWLSSAENHQWNPNEKTPATPWEDEIDRLMRAQASSLDTKARKQAIDRVQEIVAQQEPFIYLVNKDAMSAVSTHLHGTHPVILRPQVYWDIDQLSIEPETAKVQ